MYVIIQRKYILIYQGFLLFNLGVANVKNKKFKNKIDLSDNFIKITLL